MLALSLVAAGCGGDDEGDTTTTTTGDGDTTTTAESPGAVGASIDGVVKFGAILPQTGDLANFGPGMQAGVELAIADINAAGGVLDNPVELVSADSGTNPDIANTAAERLIGTEKVDAVLGAGASGVTLLGVIAPTVGAGRVQCSGSTTSPVLTDFEDDGLFFRTAPSDVFQGQLLGDTVAADGFASVAIANRADDYGQALADTIAEALQGAGAEAVEQVAFDPDGTNFDAEVEQIASANPDAVVLIAFPEEGAQFLNTMIEQGVGPNDVAIYVTDGLADDGLAESVAPGDPAVLDGVKGTRPSSVNPATEFLDRLGVETSTFAAQFYDCAILVALGAVAAGTDDPRAIADEINEISRGGTACGDFAECAGLLAEGEDIDYEGITSFDFNDLGEPDRGVYEVFEYEGGDLSTLDRVVIGEEGPEEE